MTALCLFFSNLWFSPFIVPVAGCVLALGIVLGGIYSGIRTRELQSQERLAAIAAGVPIPPTLEELNIIHGRGPADSLERRERKRGSVRRAGIVLLAVAFGMILFFVVLAAILQVREILSGAAVGLIPLAIGAGLLIDARIQARELKSLGNGGGSALGL